MKSFIEYLKEETIQEAVRVDTNEWRRSNNGKQPSGSGRWYFHDGFDEWDFWSKPNSSYKDAVKQALADYKKKVGDPNGVIHVGS